MVILDPARLAPFERGARLIAILAVPAAKETDLREKIALALCAGVIRATCAADPGDADQWRDRYPVYTDISEAQCKKDLRQLPRRLRDRMFAGRMALGFFAKGLTRADPRLPPPMARHSLNALSELVNLQAGFSGAENLEQRIWRGSHPVIHLAAAMQVVLRHVSEGIEIDEIGYPLDEDSWHQAVIEVAELHEKIVLRGGVVGVRPETLIRVRAA
jgi:hypothetical protein